MKPRRQAARRTGRPALELIEDAVHLLRSAPAGALLCYYVGSAPCLLGLLYFWADMSRGAFASERLASAVLSLALLYLWMKCWQTVFASRLRTHLLLGRAEPWTLRRVARLVLLQAAVQPTGLFLRLLAALFLLPYAWTYSFYQSFGVLGDGTEPALSSVARRAREQASLWQGQAHVALLALFGFAFFVWLNVCAAIALAPFALKTFFGIHSVFTRDPMLMLNSTFFAATLAATYLCFDPIRKAVFVLRCFHGASLRSGEDLRIEMKTITQRTRGLAAAALVFLLCATSVAAAPVAKPPPPVESAQLDESLDRVLQRREFAWRLREGEAAGGAGPHQKSVVPDAEKSGVTFFFETLAKQLKNLVRTVFEWVADVMLWFRKLLPDPAPSEDGRAALNWSSIASWTLLILAVSLISAVSIVLWRMRRKRASTHLVAESLAPVPDLNEESVSADQLPEDGWLKLAREMMEAGNLRLALRASYLAGLAHLGRRELIHLARHKSNHDYDRELRRRARGNASLMDAFSANLGVFERSWYGVHEVTTEMLGSFSQNLERIRAC